LPQIWAGGLNGYRRIAFVSSRKSLVSNAFEDNTMTETRPELRYSKNHEWVRLEDDGTVTVGITDHAQTLLGDLVFVDTPEPGTRIAAGDSCATVESVKAASDVYAPVSGEIVAVNVELADSPEQVNSAPYDAGWLFRMQLEDPAELEALLDAEGYADLVASEA